MSSYLRWSHHLVPSLLQFSRDCRSKTFVGPSHIGGSDYRNIVSFVVGSGRSWESWTLERPVKCSDETLEGAIRSRYRDPSPVLDFSAYRTIYVSAHPWSWSFLCLYLSQGSYFGLLFQVSYGVTTGPWRPRWWLDCWHSESSDFVSKDYFHWIFFLSSCGQISTNPFLWFLVFYYWLSCLE